MIRGWYLTLERVVTPLRVPNAVAATFAKVSLDQLGFAPIFNVFLISVIGLSQVTRNISPRSITQCAEIGKIFLFSLPGKASRAPFIPSEF